MAHRLQGKESILTPIVFGGLSLTNTFLNFYFLSFPLVFSDINFPVWPNLPRPKNAITQICTAVELQPKVIFFGV